MLQQSTKAIHNPETGKIEYQPVKSMLGQKIKRVNVKRVGGYLNVYTSEDDRDLHEEWFSKNTDFQDELGWKMVGKPILINHALDGVFKSMAVGVFDFENEDDVGRYVEGALYEQKDYEDMLRSMRERGKINLDDETIVRKAALAYKTVDAFFSTGKVHWSSGALPQAVSVNSENGHIDTWPRIEGSGTMTPAEPDGTEVLIKGVVPNYEYTLKSAFEELDAFLLYNKSIQTAKTQGAKEPNGAKESSVTRADVDNENTQAQGSKEMDENAIRDIIRMVIEEMRAGDGAEEVSPQEDEVMRGIEEKAADVVEDPEQTDEQKSVRIAELAADYVVKKLEATRKQQEAIRNAAKARVGAYNASLPVANDAYLPAAKHNGNGAVQAIQVGEPLKYAHLSATDMAMAWKIATAASPFGKLPTGLQGRKATDFVSEEFYRAAVHKMAAQVENTRFSRAEDSLYVKSAMPFKANELDASDITGQGLEYLGNVYDTMVWETARNNRIYQLMLGRGMMEKPVPQGMKNAVVPIEGNDPSVYGGVEGNSTDATGRPEVVYKITPQTTSTVTITPGTFRTATAYTFELGEDSFVDMAAEANRKVNLALEEHIEKAMINGDTETAASTNINDIAGTPTSTGLTRDYFLEFNGLRKSPLVTSTAYSRDGGALAVDDYRKTWALLGSTIAPRKDKIFFLIDFSTFQASLDLLPKLTRDVAGNDASLFTGEFENLWGIPIYMSGFLALSNSAGKIDLDTPGNNTKGQILAVYAPYWAFVFKRNITIEMQRSPDSETFEFYGSMRFSLTRRSAAAAAISYDLTV